MAIRKKLVEDTGIYQRVRVTAGTTEEFFRWQMERYDLGAQLDAIEQRIKLVLGLPDDRPLSEIPGGLIRAALGLGENDPMPESFDWSDLPPIAKDAFDAAIYLNTLRHQLEQGNASKAAMNALFLAWADERMAMRQHERSVVLGAKNSAATQEGRNEQTRRKKAKQAAYQHHADRIWKLNPRLSKLAVAGRVADSIKKALNTVRVSDPEFELLRVFDDEGQKVDTQDRISRLLVDRRRKGKKTGK